MTIEDLANRIANEGLPGVKPTLGILYRSGLIPRDGIGVEHAALGLAVCMSFRGANAAKHIAASMGLPHNRPAIESAALVLSGQGDMALNLYLVSKWNLDERMYCQVVEPMVDRAAQLCVVSGKALRRIGGIE